MYSLAAKLASYQHFNTKCKYVSLIFERIYSHYRNEPSLVGLQNSREPNIITQWNQGPPWWNGQVCQLNWTVSKSTYSLTHQIEIIFYDINKVFNTISTATLVLFSPKSKQHRVWFYLGPNEWFMSMIWIRRNWNKMKLRRPICFPAFTF